MGWDFFTNASIVGKLGVLVALFPVAAAVIYAIKPTERTLTLIRPLSLAAIFGGLTTLTRSTLLLAWPPVLLLWVASLRARRAPSAHPV